MAEKQGELIMKWEVKCVEMPARKTILELIALTLGRRTAVTHEHAILIAQAMTEPEQWGFVHEYQYHNFPAINDTPRRGRHHMLYSIFMPLHVTSGSCHWRTRCGFALLLPEQKPAGVSIIESCQLFTPR